MAEPVRLIVGLGNPGREYDDTRHNAGVWYLDALARHQGVFLSEEKKHFGLTASITLGGEKVRLLVPTTFMNRSGQATASLANFFKIPTQQILVAHDELDLPPGCARFKQGGGHGGHNGLRDIISRHANQRDFYRLRIGIGHPGSADRVTPHVLNKPSRADRELIDKAIEEAVSHTRDLVSGDLNGAMTRLNGFKA